MKKIIFILIILSFVFSFGYADEYEELIDEYTREYSAKIEEGLQNVDFDAEKIIRDASKGKLDLSFEKLGSWIAEIVIPEVKVASKAMLCLISVILAGAFLLNLQNSGIDGGAQKAGNLYIFLIATGLIANVFSNIAVVTYSTVSSVSLFLKCLFPVMLLSLYSAGCISSTLVFRPILSAVVTLSVHIIEKILIPVTVLSFAVTIADCLSEKTRADKFAGFMTKTVKWLLACMLTIFTGLIGLQSIATSTFDGLSVKLTKLATSNLVPVVGGLLSETVETVMGCSVVIKNSVGICGILAVLYICIVPLIKIGINILLLRFTAAVMQPVSDDKIIKCISSAADILSLLFGIVASVIVMFVLIITILINMGNSAVLFGR